MGVENKKKTKKQRVEYVSERVRVGECVCVCVCEFSNLYKILALWSALSLCAPAKKNAFVKAPPPHLHAFHVPATK